MQSEIRLLDQIRIEEPCPASWEEMTPVDGDRVRHCSHCQLNVHNLSALSREEAEDLLRRTEGRLCVQYAQRPDGKVLTDDYPHLREIRIVALKQWATAASVVAALSGLFVAGAARADKPADKPGGDKKPTAHKQAEPKTQAEIIRGELAAPTCGAEDERQTRRLGSIIQVSLQNRGLEAEQGAKKDVPVFLGRILAPPPKPQEVTKTPFLRGRPSVPPQKTNKPNSKPPAKPREGKKSKDRDAENVVTTLGSVGNVY